MGLPQQQHRAELVPKPVSLRRKEAAATLKRLGWQQNAIELLLKDPLHTKPFLAGNEYEKLLITLLPDEKPEGIKPMRGGL